MIEAGNNHQAERNGSVARGISNGPTEPFTKIQLTVDSELSHMKSSGEIQTQLAALKPELQKEYPISELGVFGSYARAEQRPESDIDVLVVFERPVTLFDLVRLENELTDQLDIDVDLVTRNSLKPRIESRVEEDVVYV